MSIENVLKPFHNEGQVQLGDAGVLRLVVDFRMIDVVEGLTGRGMQHVLTDLFVVDENDAKHALTGKVVWAMTREHHPQLSLDQIAGLIYSPEFGAEIGIVAQTLLENAFNLGAAEGKNGSRPPKGSRGASRPSARNGSRPASSRTRSGTKRHARS